MRRIITALVLLLGLTAPGSADEAQAVRTLAEWGDAKAQFALGTMYRDGQGVPRDYIEALKWLHSAANLGLLDAQFALGNIYTGGSGITKDVVQAYMWFDLAASHEGDDWIRPIAASNRDAVAAGMTPAEIAEAHDKVADWRIARGK